MPGTLFSNKGRALHLAGEWEGAAEVFKNTVQKAEDKKKKMYGLQAFCYCDFLLDRGKKKLAHSIAHTAVEKSKSVRDKGLSYLSVGKVYLALNEFNEAEMALDKAVEDMRKSSRQDELPGALLACAKLYRKRAQEDLEKAGEYLEKAGEYLNEAYEIAKNGKMELHLTDYQLEKAKYHLSRAKKRINQMKYHRRASEIKALLQTVDNVEGGDIDVTF